MSPVRRILVLLAAVAAPAALAVALAGGSAPAPERWSYVAYNGVADAWTTTPANAAATAEACRDSLTACGKTTIGDAATFLEACTAHSPAAVAAAIGAAARLAETRGGGWRVLTRTEAGGYPYGCFFTAVP